MTDQAPAAATPEEIVAREEGGRTRAGVAAIAGGLALLVGPLLSGFVSRDAPPVFLGEALRHAAGEDLGRPTLSGPQVQFISDNAAQLIGTATVTGLGWLLTGLALNHLLVAARARRPETPRFTSGLLLAGAVGMAVGAVLVYAALAVAAGSFVDDPRPTQQAARDVLENPVALAARALLTFGSLALAIAFVFTAMNAMRAGLLTRFMGFLGVITGFLLVFPLGSILGPGGMNLPIVQTFWLVTLGLVILGRLPGGRPPAWQTGKAEPWPSQLELREARERERGGGGGGGKEARTPPPEGPRTEAPSPAASKKKRKRRR